MKFKEMKKARETQEKINKAWGQCLKKERQMDQSQMDIIKEAWEVNETHILQLEEKEVTDFEEMEKEYNILLEQREFFIQIKEHKQITKQLRTFIKNQTKEI